jgi:hypothetical protein
MARDLELSCPDCGTRILVDVRTGQVLRHGPARSPDGQDDEGGWDRALQKVEGRDTRGQDRFDDALDKERRRDKDLDDLFDSARRAAKRDEEEEEQS